MEFIFLENTYDHMNKKQDNYKSGMCTKTIMCERIMWQSAPHPGTGKASFLRKSLDLGLQRHLFWEAKYEIFEMRAVKETGHVKIWGRAFQAEGEQVPRPWSRNRVGEFSNLPDRSAVRGWGAGQGKVKDGVQWFLTLESPGLVRSQGRVDLIQNAVKKQLEDEVCDCQMSEGKREEISCSGDSGLF